jgi:hypothetical protein
MSGREWAAYASLTANLVDDIETVGKQFLIIYRGNDN